MPIRKYICPTCGAELRALEPVETTSELVHICANCDIVMKKQFSQVADPVVKELLDPLHNKQLKKGTNGIMRARSKKHFVEVEIPELIEKHGEEEAKRQGWIKPDGTKKKITDCK